MMSKQRFLLPEIVSRLSTFAPDCAVLLMGSVRWGYEGPDSDIDLYVLVESSVASRLAPGRVIHEEEGMTLIEHIVQGVKVHFVWWPIPAFARSLEREPHSFYPFAKAEILYDPQGIAKRYQTISMDYFQKNPQIKKVWEMQLDKVRKHKINPIIPLEYAEWGDFADHIAKTLAPRPT